MTWMNTDGLFVKFGKEEGADARGGEVSDAQRHEVELVVDWTDLLSATAVNLGDVGTVDGGKTGSFGVAIPKGAFIERAETIALVAFTSSGTIGTSTLVMGLNKASDRTTAIAANGFFTTAVVGSTYDAVGETTAYTAGTTGAGSFFGTAISENGVICVANSQHASHPYTAGKLKIKIWYSLVQVTS